MPAFSSACWAIGRHLPDGPAEHGLPGHRDVRPVGRCRRGRRSSSRAGGSTSHCAPSEPQTVGPMPGVSDGPITTAPAPSPKMKAVPRSLEVGEVGQLLDADDQHVLGAAAAHHVAGQRDAVAEAGARGRDVHRRGRGGAEPVGEQRGRGRRLERVGDRGHQHGADAATGRARRPPGPGGTPPRPCRRRSRPGPPSAARRCRSAPGSTGRWSRSGRRSRSWARPAPGGSRRRRRCGRAGRRWAARSGRVAVMPAPPAGAVGRWADRARRGRRPRPATRRRDRRAGRRRRRCRAASPRWRRCHRRRPMRRRPAR